MSAARPLNDEDVQKQLKQMVSFILKEASEKADEIHVKAEEEFNIERQRLLQGEKEKITKDFQKKEKQLEVNKKISFSNELNYARLRTLKAREDAVIKIVLDTFRSLPLISEGSNYPNLLVDLIVQAAIKLNEPTAHVICREVDRNHVQAAIPKAIARYKEITGKDVKLSVDNVNKLSPPPVEGSDAPACAGGIVLSTNEGKIICNNTLEQRLGTAHEQLLPTIRTILFGRSESRRYFN
jgi:V-type H+-transporting ATPase subunit E